MADTPDLNYLYSNDEMNLDYIINGVNTSEFYCSCDYYSYDVK